MKLTLVTKEGRTIGYFKPKEAMTALAHSTIADVKVHGNMRRITLANDEIYVLSNVNKEIGSEVSNICPVCNRGDVVFSGGCNTCNVCGCQLKCGL